MSLVAKQRAAGWIFLAPATIMIAVMSFYPMIRAFIISLQTGAGANMRFADPIFSNYKRIMMDKVFQQSIVNTFLYLIIQVPIMLIRAILLAQLQVLLQRALLLASGFKALLEVAEDTHELTSRYCRWRGAVGVFGLGLCRFGIGCGP